MFQTESSLEFQIGFSFSLVFLKSCLVLSRQPKLYFYLEQYCNRMLLRLQGEGTTFTFWFKGKVTFLYLGLCLRFGGRMENPANHPEMDFIWECDGNLCEYL